MEKMNCEIISDLLPLYCDDVCSPGSRRLVEEHLDGCEECRMILKQMKAECRIAQEQELHGEEIVKDMASIWMKSTWNSFIKGLFTAACLCLLLAGSYLGLTRCPIVDVPAENIEVKVESGTDEFDIYLEASDGKKVCFFHTMITEDGKLFLMAKRGVIAVKNGAGENWIANLTVPHIDLTEQGSRVEVKEIYYGTGSDSKMIWNGETP